MYAYIALIDWKQYNPLFNIRTKSLLDLPSMNVSKERQIHIINMAIWLFETWI